MASLVAGLLGGVIQTTPYIGHPAYKKMGGRTAYTLATALFIGGVGCCGGFTLLFPWLPKAAMFPILVFVGLEITAQSFQATPTRHYPALALAMLPALAYLVVVELKATFGFLTPATEDGVLLVQTLRCLANGFLITGLLWAAALAMLLDGKPGRAAAFLALAGAVRLLRRHPLAAGLGADRASLQHPTAGAGAAGRRRLLGGGALPDAVPLGGGLWRVGVAACGVVALQGGFAAKKWFRAGSVSDGPHSVAHASGSDGTPPFNHAPTRPASAARPTG